MFDKEQLNIIFNLVDTFRTCLIKERQIYHILKGKVSDVVSVRCQKDRDSRFSILNISVQPDLQFQK